MIEHFVSFFHSRKNRTVRLSELENLVTGSIDYFSFAEIILQMEKKQILTPVKSHGKNGKSPSLAFTYRINKGILNQEFHEKLKLARLKLHPSINLEAYFTMSSEQWDHDYPYLEKVHQYIINNGFPTKQVPAPERSYEIAENEKWITEGGGQELLERVDLWEKFSIIPVAEPLMFAINPALIQNQTHFHLIVENKTTYQGLLPSIQNSSFTTLIYGSGKKILKGIEHFYYQLPLPCDNHKFYYFGDLDHEGILIWYLLSKKVPAIPALPFYEYCFTKPSAIGKQNQRPNEEALTAFLPYFKQSDQDHIKSTLQGGGYYPQEVIKNDELQHIWRNSQWI